MHALVDKSRDTTGFALDLFLSVRLCPKRTGFVILLQATPELINAAGFPEQTSMSSCAIYSLGSALASVAYRCQQPFCCKKYGRYRGSGRRREQVRYAFEENSAPLIAYLRRQVWKRGPLRFTYFIQRWPVRCCQGNQIGRGSCMHCDVGAVLWLALSGLKCFFRRGPALLGWGCGRRVPRLVVPL